MLRLSKAKFSQAIEESHGTTDNNVQGTPDTRAPVDAAPVAAPVDAKKQSTPTSRLVVTALVVALGIGAGWVGGKVLNGRMNHSAAAIPDDVSTGDNSVPSTQSQPDSRPARRAAVPGEPSTSSQPSPEGEKPDVASKPRPKDEAKERDESKEAQPKEALPKVPRVEKDEEADKATGEDPAKEIGRKALKEMNRETRNKNGKSPGNKNASEDQQ